MGLFRKISENIIARNLVLAFCALVVFAAVTALALNIFTRHNQRKPVPDFIGLHISDVRSIAEREGLRIEVLDSLYAPVYGGGAVIEQLPTGGTEVKKGRRIFVTITSHQQKMVPVPFVTGFSLRQAKNLIEMAGLEIKELRYVSNIATGNVLAEMAGRDTVRRNSNLQLEAGSGVTLVVGRAPEAPPASVPRTVGLSLGQAKSVLWERGFNVGEIHLDDDINLINQKDAAVYRQTPAHNYPAALGTRVTLWLTLDEAKIDDGVASADRAGRQLVRQQEAERAASASASASASADSLPNIQ
jgi:beta-lactam-binding protein with PASTA domain